MFNKTYCEGIGYHLFQLMARLMQSLNWNEAGGKREVDRLNI